MAGVRKMTAASHCMKSPGRLYYKTRVTPNPWERRLGAQSWERRHPCLPDLKSNSAEKPRETVIAPVRRSRHGCLRSQAALPPTS